MTSLNRLIGLIILIGVSSAGSAALAQVAVEPDQQYLLLATSPTSTMQEELHQVAALGFRVISSSPLAGGELVIFLERVATPPDTYQYELLATSRFSTLLEEVNAATAQGARLLPRSFMVVSPS